MKHSLRTRVGSHSFLSYFVTLFMLFVVCAGLFSASPVRAANGSLTWVKNLGGPSGDNGTHIEVDAAGNVYTTGAFSGTADFDPGPGTHGLTSAGNADIFIAKLDRDGNLVWARRMGGVDVDVGSGLALDGSGSLYIVGSFLATADFDPGAATALLTSAGGEDIFISKLDSNGSFLWVKSLGGLSADFGTHLEVDSTGDVYLTGGFSGTADFDPGPGTVNLTSAGSLDIFVAKLKSNGDFVWARGMGGVNSDASYSLALDITGGVYTTDYFEGLVDFDPGPGTASPASAGSSDIFVSKLDRDGNFVWARSMGGPGLDSGNAISVDAAGVHTTGRFEGTADFDPGLGAANLTSAGAADIFVSKLDSNGSFLWARGMGGADVDEGMSLTLDAKSHVYITGSFRGPADFDPGAGTFTLNSAGVDDIFVSNLDRNGNFVWVRSMGGAGVDEGAGLSLDASGDVYTTGSFAGTADFDPHAGIANLTSAGAADVFIVKLEEGAIFTDVPSGYWAQDFIERLYAAGITGGCATSPLRYCPEDTVTRAQMAVFLLRGIHTASYTPPAIGAGSGFNDVSNDYWAASFVKQLAAEGITSGCGGGSYCPEQPVTRAQMAVFLLKSKHGAGYIPPAVGGGSGFGDVPPDYWASAFIKQLVTEGITAGCGNGNYCPEQPVTRAQMAVFLVRTFALP